MNTPNDAKKNVFILINDLQTMFKRYPLKLIGVKTITPLSFYIFNTPKVKMKGDFPTNLLTLISLTKVMLFFTCKKYNSNNDLFWAKHISQELQREVKAI